MSNQTKEEAEGANGTVSLPDVAHDAESAAKLHDVVAPVGSTIAKLSVIAGEKARGADDETEVGLHRKHTFVAFITYSHVNEKIGAWLHRRLESYAIPRSLVGQESPIGRISGRLGKVFRDRADLAATTDLSAGIRRGLDESNALIVLCSPHARGSPYVNDEIAYFKSLGRGDRIFAAIVSGVPNASFKPGLDAMDECYPKALTFRVDEDGKVTDEREPLEALAADFREGKDAHRYGALKLVAALLDVEFDDLVQRERRAENVRRIRNYATGLIAGLLICALGLALVYGWLQSDVAARNAERAVLGEERALSVVRFYEQRTLDERREVERVRRNYTGQTAFVRALAERTDSESRNTLARLFAERGLDAIDLDNRLLALRYAVAGWRFAPANAREYQLVAARAILGGSESRPLVGGAVEAPRAVWSADTLHLATPQSDYSVEVLDTRRGVPVARLVGHTAPISSVRFSADGERIVTASEDLSARIWDTNTGRQLRLLQGHEHWVNGAEFSLNGDRVVTTGQDRTARIWDAWTGQQLVVLQEDAAAPFRSAAFSPAGAQIITVSESGLQIWNSVTGQNLRRLEDEPTYELQQVRFSIDGTQIETAPEYTSARVVWNVDTGRIAVAGRRTESLYNDLPTRAWDARRLPLQTLLRIACANFLNRSEYRRFSAEEIEIDPLLRYASVRTDGGDLCASISADYNVNHDEND